MKFTKILSLALCACVLLSITGCGSKNTETKPAETEPPPHPPPPPPAPPNPAAPNPSPPKKTRRQVGCLGPGPGPRNAGCRNPEHRNQACAAGGVLRHQLQ